MTGPGVQRRPGGRSARVRASVLEATQYLLDTLGMDVFTVAAVAERAGVHETSIYRRWGTRENLMLDALLSTVHDRLPVPDTGSLREDLTAYATSLATHLRTPSGLAMNRALAASGDSPDVTDARTRFWDTRYTLSSQIITRAIARGELPPDTDVRMALEIVLAPLHMRALLTRDPIDPALPSRLVNAVLTALGTRPD